MKVGDLVRSVSNGILINSGRVGILVEVVHGGKMDKLLVCRVMWENGSIEKDWSDELEVVHEKG